MEFEGLTARLSGVFKSFAEKAVFKKDDDEALREVRRPFWKPTSISKVVRSLSLRSKKPVLRGSGERPNRSSR